MHGASLPLTQDVPNEVDTLVVALEALDVLVVLVPADTDNTSKLSPRMVKKVLILCIKYYYILQINLPIKFFL